MKRAVLWTLAVLCLFTLPAFAARVTTIDNGIDVWITHPDGTSFLDFDKLPIPAGFFCDKAGAFTGKVLLRGRPLATGVPGELGFADTVVQRLDDARFNKNGVAVTRVQIRALQLQSIAPVKTACGEFDLLVVLNGEQPITKMRILRQSEDSGRFIAPVAVNYKLIFTPVGGLSGERRELTAGFQLSPARNAKWTAARNQKRASRASTVVVDTDGDQIPDTYLPMTSGNFVIGRTPEQVRSMKQTFEAILYDCTQVTGSECHEEAGQHCAQPCW